MYLGTTNSNREQQMLILHEKLTLFLEKIFKISRVYPTTQISFKSSRIADPFYHHTFLEKCVKIA